MRIRALRAQDRPVERAVQGDRCAINLAGRVRKEDIRRGDWIVAERAHVRSRRLDAEVRVLGSEDRPLKHWTPVHVHLGTADTTGRIAILEGKEIPVGEAGLVQLVLDTPVNASAGDAVIVRDQSARRTIGGGRIIDPHSPARGRARPDRLTWVKALGMSDRNQALETILENAPGGARLHMLEAAWNVTEAEAETLRRGADVCCVGTDAVIGLSQAHRDSLEQSILTALDGWHRDNPGSGGANEAALMRTLPFRCHSLAFDRVVADLVQAGEVVRAGALLQRRGFEASLTGPDERIWRRVLSVMDTAGDKPPTIWEIAEELDIDQKQVAGLLARVARIGLVMRVSANRYMTMGKLRELAAIAEDGARGMPEARFNAAAYRDWSGMGRNLSIEILEFFDKLKFTRRVGNEREILKPAGQVFGAEKAGGHQKSGAFEKTNACTPAG